MEIKFVCGAEVALKHGEKYACYPMAVCNTAKEAALANQGLNPSFGFAIYEVDVSNQQEVSSSFGPRAGRKTQGMKINRCVGMSYEILDKH